MDRLEVRGHQVCVSPGHLKRTVAQNFLEMEHRATTTQICDRPYSGFLSELVTFSCDLSHIPGQ
jgi:hypothetical protein